MSVAVTLTIRWLETVYHNVIFNRPLKSVAFCVSGERTSGITAKHATTVSIKHGFRKTTGTARCDSTLDDFLNILLLNVIDFQNTEAWKQRLLFLLLLRTPSPPR